DSLCISKEAEARRRSRREPLDQPAVGVAAIGDTVMQARMTPLPEFEAIRQHAITTPVRRPRHVRLLVGITRGDFGEPLIESRTIRAAGRPSALTVASVIALGSGTRAATASSNQRANWRSGSRSTSRSSSEARW